MWQVLISDFCVAYPRDAKKNSQFFNLMIFQLPHFRCQGNVEESELLVHHSFWCKNIFKNSPIQVYFTHMYESITCMGSSFENSFSTSWVAHASIFVNIHFLFSSRQLWIISAGFLFTSMDDQRHLLYVTYQSSPNPFYQYHLFPASKHFVSRQK